MSEWQETFLNEVIEIIGGGTPKTSKEDYWSGNIPWLSVVDFGNGNRWVSKTEKTITEEGLKNSSTKLLDKGDLIISARGTVGELAQLSKPMAFNQSCYGIRAKSPLSNGYLYYLLKYSLQKIRKNTHGSVFNTITRDTFENIDIRYPESKNEINKIEKTLSCLDSKIENLQKQNQILEKIAQTLFKQWFVDFNFPDENGKPYKDNGGEMVGSELGNIPKGWSIGALGKVANVTSSKRIFLSEYINEGVPFYRSKEIIELRSGKSVSTELFIPVERFNEIKKKFGVPVENDILMTSVGTIGIPYLVKKDDNFYFKDGNLTWIRNFKKGFNGVFIFYWLLSKSVQHQIKSNTIGSTQKALTIDALKNLDFLVPLPQILKKFFVVLDSLNKKIEKNTYQIKTLTRIRDTLLPKLMSGKIRVSE